MALTEEEYLLQCLSEECAEVSVEASKCIRFTKHNRYQLHTNLERLNIEYSQLMAIIFKLQSIGVEIQVSQEHFDNKLLATANFMDISRGLGTLEPEEVEDVGDN